MDGLLVLDKPGGMTSRDALNRVQRRFPRGTRIGHTGTLDPLATGVLVVCVGQATRLAEYVQSMRKTYRSTFLLGARSDTDDADGTVTPVEGPREISRAEIETSLAAFVGEIEQTPPAYSAAKVTGQRAYDLARRGEDVDLKPRRVLIYGIDILACSWPTLEVEVRCGKGTYIRSIARDLGDRLGCGGYVQVLRRMRVGPFSVDDAVGLDSESPPLRPVAEALAELPHVVVSADEAVRLRQGQTIPHDGSGEVAVFDADNGLVAIANADETGKRLRPVKTFSV
ncbi:MAG: tRNA pseudouridine(55) synthase TruB [Gemmataceae bacterium]